MLEDGIDINELIGTVNNEPKKRKRTPLPPKYRFLDENGLEKTWTGQGRTRSALQKLIDQGCYLDEFEIK
jgi:DNA-binding protein H-NS